MPSKTTLFICLALSLACNTFAQEQVAVELKEAKIMYRGYPNVIFVPQDSCTEFVTDVVVVSNGTIEKCENPGEYVVSPGSYRYTKLAVVRRSGDAIVDTLRVMEFYVRNLPAPQLYWGRHERGMAVHLFEDFLFAKYGDHIFLTAAFNIMSWTFYIDDQIISGTGRNVIKVKEYFMDYSSPIKVIVVAKVIGPDKREYEIQGDWVVMPGAANIKEPYRPDPCIYRE